MTIPDKPLAVNLDPNEMTLDEACLFTPGGFDIAAFRAFLIAHTNWERAEIGALRMSELKDVAERIAAALKGGSVPLAKPRRSRRGRAVTAS